MASSVPTSGGSTELTGMTLDQEQKAHESGQSLVDSRNESMSLAETEPKAGESKIGSEVEESLAVESESDPSLAGPEEETMQLATYSGSPALSTTARSLEDALQANSTYRTDLNFLYGATISTAGTNSSADNQKLNSIVTMSGYSQSDYLSDLTRAASLARTLRANSTARVNVNRAYTATLSATGTPDSDDRTKLFGLVNKTAYNQTDFMSIVTSWGSGTKNQWELALALQGNGTNRADFNLLYNAYVPDNGSISSTDRSTISSVTGNSAYTGLSSYVTKINKAAGLLRALRANSTYRNAYNSRYSASIQASGTVSSDNRGDLYTTVNQSGYSQSTFLASLTGSVPQPPQPPTTPPTPPASGGTLFGSTTFWNSKLSGSTAIRSNSSTYRDELIRNTKLSGGVWMNTNAYSTPVYYVNSSTAKVKVSVVQGGTTLSSTNLHKEWQKGVPIPAGVIAAAGTDGHLTVIDTSTDTLYEFWRFRKLSNGTYAADWGGIIKNQSTSNGQMPIVTNASGGKEYWGATATGLPAVGGTIMLKELQAGVIKHALALAIPEPKAGTFLWPATRTDGWKTTANAIPEGMRFKLPANVTINPAWSPMMKMIVTAARDYGIVLRDKAGAVTFFAEDRSQYGSNPYSAYYGGKSLTDVMKEFPWGSLQALA